MSKLDKFYVSPLTNDEVTVNETKDSNDDITPISNDRFVNPFTPLPFKLAEGGSLFCSCFESAIMDAEFKRNNSLSKKKNSPPFRKALSLVDR